ncbi:hypothetical protein K466DRAFT_604062 [Polyporus arcularius HHB13444]|uniref:Uncharacterized protein n=1 Tax=Polyporus arcularius HHB13444 TaxID=1314778 RepID=A0A5C3NX97_9APHY|nr:hypothetical protein K466DRAFT_604062 [Polyporus arcularius HHB13444]
MLGSPAHKHANAPPPPALLLTLPPPPPPLESPHGIDEVSDLLKQVQRTLPARQDNMSLESVGINALCYCVILSRWYTLGEQMNSRRLLNSLPDELVMEIFKHVLYKVEPCRTTALDVNTTARVDTRPSSGSLISAAGGGASRWVILLWQRIDCHDPEQLQEFSLHRSSPGPFSLFHLIFSNKSRLTSGLALLRRLVVPGSARTYLNIDGKAPVSVLTVLPSTADTERLTVFTPKCVELMVSARCSYPEFWLYASD